MMLPHVETKRLAAYNTDVRDWSESDFGER